MGDIYLNAICLDVKEEKRREGHRSTWGTLWLSEDFVPRAYHSKRLWWGSIIWMARCVHNTYYYTYHIVWVRFNGSMDEVGMIMV